MNTHVRLLGRMLVALLMAVAVIGVGGAGVARADHAPSWWDPSWCQWIPDHEYCHGGGGGTEAPIEAQFTETGPWAVTTSTASVPGTGGGVFLAYPTNLGDGGYEHPILTWGNGTGEDGPPQCENHEELSGGMLSHLASWGYVVVCPQSGSNGFGNEMLAAAEWLVGQDGNQSSAFYGALDTAKVGAIGHSQGASGAVNATIQSDGLITSTVGLSLVDPMIHFWSGGQPPDFGQLDAPFFLVTGTFDLIAREEHQRAYFDRVPGAAAKAAINGADHPGTMAGSHGYATAWFKYTLEGDQTARSAFAGGSPEIPANPKWLNWASKNLP